MTLEDAKKEAVAKSEKDTNNYYHVTKPSPQFEIYLVERYWTRESKYYAHKGKLLKTEP